MRRTLIIAAVAGMQAGSSACALTILPVVVDKLSNEEIRQPHRASIYGADYFVQVRTEERGFLVESTGLVDFDTLTALALSRDGSVPFTDTPKDRKSALEAARAYCTEQGMLGEVDLAEITFHPARPGDNPEMVVDYMCDLARRADQGGN